MFLNHVSEQNGKRNWDVSRLSSSLVIRKKKCQRKNGSKWMVVNEKWMAQRGLSLSTVVLYIFFFVINVTSCIIHDGAIL